MTVTVEEPLWKAMKKHPEVRWSAVMKRAAEDKLRALEVLERVVGRKKLSDEEIRAFAIKLGKEITGRK